MNAHDVIKEIEDKEKKSEVSDFRVGDTVKVYNKIREGNRERIQIFEGFVLKRQNGGIGETFTVRRIASGVGVEKTFPLHSPWVEKIEIVRRGDVRRAKLNYMRERTGKAAKIKVKEGEPRLKVTNVVEETVEPEVIETVPEVVEEVPVDAAEAVEATEEAVVEAAPEAEAVVEEAAEEAKEEAN